jgi:hypothetical protein
VHQSAFYALVRRGYRRYARMGSCTAVKTHGFLGHWVLTCTAPLFAGRAVWCQAYVSFFSGETDGAIRVSALAQWSVSGEQVADGTTSDGHSRSSDAAACSSHSPGD